MMPNYRRIKAMLVDVKQLRADATRMSISNFTGAVDRFGQADATFARAKLISERSMKAYLVRLAVRK